MCMKQSRDEKLMLNLRKENKFPLEKVFLFSYSLFFTWKAIYFVVKEGLSSQKKHNINEY